jgi:hypothetical protein
MAHDGVVVVVLLEYAALPAMQPLQLMGGKGLPAMDELTNRVLSCGRKSTCRWSFMTTQAKSRYRSG